MRIVCRRHAVQLVDVDIRGVELAQRVVQRGDDPGWVGAAARPRERRFAAHDDLVAAQRLDRLAEYRLGPVGGRGVEQIDAICRGGMNNRDRARLIAVSAEPQTAEPAAAKSGDADPHAGTAERCVLHQAPLLACAAKPYWVCRCGAPFALRPRRVLGGLPARGDSVLGAVVLSDGKIFSKILTPI